MNHSKELRVPRALYERRKARFKRLFALDAPDVVLCAEAELFLRSFRWSWGSWWHSWRLKHFPHWLLWLTMMGYRECCRSNKETDAQFLKAVNVAATEKEHHPWSMRAPANRTGVLPRSC